MTVRIVVADDHVVFRSGLRSLLERVGGFEVVGEAGSSSEVLAKLAATGADVLLLDLSMPGDLSGSRLAEEVVRCFPRTRIVVLTMHEDVRYLREMFRVGVHGYVLKKSSVEDVVRAVAAAARGEFHADASLGGSAVSSLLAPDPPPANRLIDVLTSREREVCRLLALGYTNSETGEKLFISERTVETHRNNIMAKLGLENRAELVRFALDNRLIE